MRRAGTFVRAAWASNRVRVVLMLTLATAIVWIVPESPRRSPIVLVALGVPLLLRLVPRNPLYGLRTPYTCSKDEAWYIQNAISGGAMILVGLVWLVRALL